MRHRPRHHDHGSLHHRRDIFSELGNLLGLGGHSSDSDSHTHTQDDNGGGSGQTSTFISYVYVTASATFTGPIAGYTTLTEGPTTVNTDPPVNPTTSTTHKKTHEQSSETSTVSTTTTTSTPTPSSTFSVTTTTSSKTTVFASTAAAVSSAASASITSTSSASSGLSGGAKAGLAIGILCLVALLAGAAVFVIHKRRKIQDEAAAGENEKFPYNSRVQPPPPPPPASLKPTSQLQSPRLNTPTTPSAAPRLSLTPVNSNLSHSSDINGPRAGNAFAAAAAAGVGVAAAAGVSRNLTGESSPERLYTGSAHVPPQLPPIALSKGSGDAAPNPFQDPVNPFSTAAERATTPSSAGTNNLASSGTPSTTSPATSVSDKLATGGAAAAAAATGLAVGAVASRTVDEHHVNELAPSSRTPSPTASARSFGSQIDAAPMSPSTGPMNVHRVQMDFKPTMEDEMELRAGQLVRLTHEFDDGWARCSRMDGSQTGVVPRTCLSARPVKPRRGPPPSGFDGPGPRGPPPMRPDGRPMSPMGRPMSPAGRPMTPNGRSMSPAGTGRSMSPGPGGPPRFYSAGRPRSPSQPFPAPPRPGQGGRSMSPARGDVPRPMTPSHEPYHRSASPGLPPQRPRANSAGGAIGNNARTNVAPKPSPLGGYPQGGPLRNQGYPPPGPPPKGPPPNGPIERKPVAPQI